MLEAAVGAVRGAGSGEPDLDEVIALDAEVRSALAAPAGGHARSHA